MSAAEDKKKKSKKTGFWEFLAMSFWRVFTIPFRGVRFVYRKLSAIPLKHLVLLAAIFIGLVVVTMTILIKATSQPAFCVTCHYMKPYFASWQESSHNDVHCTECHFPPGVKSTIQGKFTAIAMVANYMTGVYRKSKPWAEVSDQSCLRSGCHETRLLQGKVPFKEGIIFDHAPHLLEDRRGKRLRCTSCHSQIVQGNHMTVTEETCFLCHFKDQLPGSRMNSCTWCHDAPVAADSAQVVFDHTHILEKQTDCHLCHGDMARGNGDVPKERCSYCHAETGKLERYSETIELHKIHITQHKVECNHCHNTILHRSISRTGDIKPDCHACHIDRHLAQYSLFSGQGAIGVDPLPATMFHAGLGCKACHVILPDDWKEHPGLATSKAGPASCTPCHEEAYYKLYQQAKPILTQRIAEVDSRIKLLKKKSLGPDKLEILAASSENVSLLKRGKPIHNLNYSDRILEEITRSLDELEGKSPLPRALPDTTSARCVRCHFRQDERIVSYENKSFSHRNHVHSAELGCTTCHIEAKPDHGKLKGGSFCMDCHHQSALVSCEPCHSNQRNFIAGKGLFKDFEPDVMSEAELTCRDCHEVLGAEVHRPDAEACENCHEPDYWDDQIERQTDYVEQIKRLKDSLGQVSDESIRQRATELLKALEADGTKGAHNPVSAFEVIDTIHNLLLSAQSEG
jgi:hypothetical protein